MITAANTDLMDWVANNWYLKYPGYRNMISKELVVRNVAFHKTIPGYAVTPLLNQQQLAGTLGVANIYVKDEGGRFGLKAYKGLGGSLAVFNLLKVRLAEKVEINSFNDLFKPEVKAHLKDFVLCACTDGNHGKGVAWMAKLLGVPCYIYMPHHTVPARVAAIEALGAKVTVTDLNYDNTMRKLMADKTANGWQEVNDNSIHADDPLSTWVLQGYSTIMAEVDQQLQDERLQQPTHVFVQAGVGTFAAAIADYLYTMHGDDMPKFVVVEPEKADCYYQSMTNGDGKPHHIQSDLDTIMAGLACGEPYINAWDVLSQTAVGTLRCPDYVAGEGVRLHANPGGSDTPVVAGESGAVTLGAVKLLMKHPRYDLLRQQLGLNADSRILLLNTEADTDPVRYQAILKGDYALPAEVAAVLN